MCIVQCYLCSVHQPTLHNGLCLPLPPLASTAVPEGTPKLQCQKVHQNCSARRYTRTAVPEGTLELQCQKVHQNCSVRRYTRTAVSEGTPGLQCHKIHQIFSVRRTAIAWLDSCAERQITHRKWSWAAVYSFKFLVDSAQSMLYSWQRKVYSAYLSVYSRKWTVQSVLNALYIRHSFYMPDQYIRI